MTSPDFCRLYLDTALGLAEVRSLLAAEVAVVFPGYPVHAAVSRNDGFKPLAGRPYDPIAASPWTAEIDGEGEGLEAIEAFQASACHLIARLRVRGLIVTAACDFEDRVIAETGWNWTADAPEPPR